MFKTFHLLCSSAGCCIYPVTLYCVAVTFTRIKTPIHAGTWRQASYSPVTSHFCRDVMRAPNCSDSDMYSTNMNWLPVCKGEQADQKDLMRVCCYWVWPTTRTFKAASSTLQQTQKKKETHWICLQNIETTQFLEVPNSMSSRWAHRPPNRDDKWLLLSNCSVVYKMLCIQIATSELQCCGASSHTAFYLQNFGLLSEIICIVPPWCLSVWSKSQVL